MSNLHRRYGDSTPYDDHDLHQEPGTDASHDDADVLDAWLNEIARNDGSPDTRSGNGHDRPDVRTDDHDGIGAAASLPATATRFHRRIETAQSRDFRAAGPDPHLWETIMEKSTAPPTQAAQTSASANPWIAAPSASTPGASALKPRQGRARPRAGRRQQTWNMVANVALVAAIVLAGFGLWRLSGEPGLPGGSDEPPTAPGLAIQPSTPGSTPETTESPHVTAPPVSTPQPATNCDLSEDIPILNGVDESAWDGTAVLLTTSGDVVLSCPAEPEGTVLATTSQYGSVAPQEWPGVVLVPSFGEAPDEARTRVVSLITGEVVEFGLAAENLDLGTRNTTKSPWLAGPAPGDTSDVQVLDLRTMQTRLLSEVAGTAPPEHGGYLTSGDGTGGTLVFGLQTRHTTEGNGTLITGSELPGDLLVLNGNFESASWVSVPEDFPPVIDFTVSPDGEHVALRGATNQLDQNRKDAFSIIRLGDGQEIIRSSTFSNHANDGVGVWVQDGAAFAYINGSELRILPIDPNLPEQPVFQSDGPLTDLRITTDSSRVLVNQEWGNELATMVAHGETPRIFSVDVGTDDAIMLTGVDVSNNLRPWPYPHRFLVTYQPRADQGDTITYEVVDTLNGNVIDEIEDVPLNDPGGSGYPNIAFRAALSSEDGNTEIISFDSQHTYLMRLVHGQPEIQYLPPPEGILAETPMPISVNFSPDGALVSMSGQNDESGKRYLLDVTEEQPAWQEVPPSGGQGAHIAFVPGTGNIPEPVPDLGFDFSDVPDGTEFMNHDELAEALRATEDNFAWPAGYDPDVEAIIEQAFPTDNSRYQAGGEYTILGSYNQCAWYQTWLDARERGDEAAAQEALRVMTDEIPYFPNHHPTSIDWLLKIAATAAEGDPAMVQQHVTVNCQGLYWETGS